MWVVSCCTVLSCYGRALLGCVLLACYHVTVHDVMPVASGKDLKQAESGRPEAMKVDKLILNPPQHHKHTAHRSVVRNPSPAQCTVPPPPLPPLVCQSRQTSPCPRWQTCNPHTVHTCTYKGVSVGSLVATASKALHCTTSTSPVSRSAGSTRMKDLATVCRRSTINTSRSLCGGGACTRRCA